MKQAWPGAAPRNKSQRSFDRAPMLLIAGAALLICGLSVGVAAADPITVLPASSGWERFNPTLELPRIYNSDGSLPSNAEMPALTPDESSPDTNLPPPDAIDPSAAAPSAAAASPDEPSASETAPAAPPVTHGDAAAANDGHHDAAASSAPAGDDEDSSAEAPLPEADPETMLSEPSVLDPTDGTEQPAPYNSENNQPAADANGNQNQPADTPSVVLIPPPSPYYGAPVPAYGYPYYGRVLGAYSSFPRAAAAAGPPAIPAGSGFGVTPPPGYPWLGPSSTTAWTASHPPFPGHLGVPSRNLLMPKSHLSLPSFPVH